MSYTETPTQTIEKFIPSWRETDPGRLSQEIISTFNETHRKPDEYKYKFANGKLVDFQTGQEIFIDKSSYLGLKDAEFLEVLNSWVSENESGVALWISPSFESAYPCNKISIYQLESSDMGEKTTFNVSVLFDAPRQKTLEIASRLNPAFENINDPEFLRNKLFAMDQNFGLTSLLELIGSEQFFPETPSVELINYFVDEIRMGVSPEQIAREMQEKGITGKFSVSCGGSSKAASLDGNSLTLNFGAEDEFGSLDFACPHCGATNTRPFGHLISNCQHCGADVRC